MRLTGWSDVCVTIKKSPAFTSSACTAFQKLCAINTRLWIQALCDILKGYCCVASLTNLHKFSGTLRIFFFLIKTLIKKYESERVLVIQ